MRRAHLRPRRHQVGERMFYVGCVRGRGAPGPGPFGFSVRTEPRRRLARRKPCSCSFRPKQLSASKDHRNDLSAFGSLFSWKQRDECKESAICFLRSPSFPPIPRVCPSIHRAQGRARTRRGCCACVSPRWPSASWPLDQSCDVPTLLPWRLDSKTRHARPSRWRHLQLPRAQAPGRAPLR